MEIADLFVVNKADREGADRLMAELRMTREIQQAASGWDVPIVATQAHRGLGVEALYEAIQAHRRFLEESGELHRRREQHRRNELWDLVEHRVRQRLATRVREDSALTELVEQVMRAEVDPHTAAARILDDEDMLRRWLLPQKADAEPSV
jgi:LAO/AO transport system kinase